MFDSLVGYHFSVGSDGSGQSLITTSGPDKACSRVRFSGRLPSPAGGIADALDLRPSAFGRVGATPTRGTSLRGSGLVAMILALQAM